MLDVCLSDEFVIKKQGSWKFILHTWTAAVFEAFQMNVEEQCGPSDSYPEENSKRYFSVAICKAKLAVWKGMVSSSPSGLEKNMINMSA